MGNMNTAGKLIVIEGPDGSGKKTHAKKLSERLDKEGMSNMQVAFPNYGSPQCAMVEKYLDPNGGFKNLYGEDNLTYIKQASLFYAIDRVATFIDTKNETGESLLEMLRQGMHIVCDRYTTSNILHQVGNLSHTEHMIPYIDWVQDTEYYHLGLPKPDLVIFLDVVPEISMENMRRRYHGKDGVDKHENMAHLSKVFERKDRVIKYCGWEKINCCDDKGKMLPQEVIHKSIFKKVRKVLNQK